MKFRKNWKRIIAGFLAATMVFLSVDAGCISALAAEIQELNNGTLTEKPTGYLALEQLFVDGDVLDEEIYSYEELSEISTFTTEQNREWDKYSNYFYYNQLSEDWKKVWDALDLVCLEFLTSENDAISQVVEDTMCYFLNPITVPEGVTMEELEIQIELFLNSAPQYYFLNNMFLISGTETEEGIAIESVILCVYEKFAVGTERTEATEAFQSAINAVLTSNEINADASEADKLRFAHDYIVKNVEYNHTITTDDPATDDVNEAEITDLEDEEAISQSAFSALCMDKTVCAGYAEALQLLCNGFGVDAISVTSIDHQWNKVYIDHTWYNVDATWADAGSEYPIFYDYYARSTEVYEDTSDSQYLSHVESDFYGNYAPACPIDIIPVNDWEAPGEFTEVTEYTAAPEVNFMKAGTNEETGEQRYMVMIQPDSSVINVSNPAHCYYTTDGTEPSIAKAKSVRYREPFYVEGDYNIKVKVVQSGYLDSEVAVYTNVESLPKVENVANKSHFYQKQTFVWNAMSETVDGYIIKVFNSADSTQIGDEIDITNGNTNFYLYDTSALAQGTSIYYEIYGYIVDENEQEVPVTETTVSGKTTVNLLSEPLDAIVKWHVTTSDGANLLVVNVEENTQDKLCLWYFTDKNGINSLNNFTLDMTDGVTEFKYSFETHGVAYDEIGYMFITDEAKSTAFQENGFVVGGEYQAPVLKPIEDVQLESTGDSVVLKAEIEDESRMKNFNYKYQWYIADDATSKGTPIEGATSEEYTVQIGSFDVKYYYCEVTAEYLTKNVYQTQNALPEEGVEAKHTRVQGALFNTNIKYNKIEEQVYDGTAKTPVLTLKNELDEILVLDTDYTVEYLNNTNAGEATIQVDFIGSYDALENAIINFEILPKQASKDTLEFTDVVTGKEYIYNGTAFTPAMEVKDPVRNVLLVSGGDYDIAYNANTDVGTATITLKFKGNYEGRVVIDFEIKAKSAENVTIDSIADQIFTGQAIVPVLNIKDGEKVLVVDKDYTVSCVKNTHVGVADVTIQFIGNYDGTKTTKFNIVPRDASEVSVTAIENQEYTGYEIEPVLDVVYRNGDFVTVLTKESNYTVAYSDNVNLGTATITLTFDGDFKGTKIVNFTIVPRNAENLTYSELENFTYDSTEHKPSVTIKNGELLLVEGMDYIVEYVDNINAGTGKAIVKFEGFEGCSGNYSGTKELTFQIAQKVATECTVTLERLDDYTFTGSEFKPAVTVMNGEIQLVERTTEMEESEGDYIVTYTNNINAGDATVTVTFINNYTGESSRTFTIERKPITEADIEIESIADQTYIGTTIIPENIVVKEKVSGVTLRLGQDYSVVAGGENTYVGIGTVIISLVLDGNYIYTGEDIEVSFNIVARDASNVEISPIPEQRYTGSAITPTLEVKDGDIVLVAGRDYTVEYENNIEVGTEAKVTISFMGNFTGESKIAYFTIIDPIPEYITSSIFTVNQTNGYISKITVGTTVYTLWSSLNERDYVNIFDKNGNVISGENILATGMTAGIMDDGEVLKRYTVVVTGDVNGDGVIDIADMVAVKAQVLGKGSLTGAKLKAGDVNKIPDGIIDIADFVRIKAHILNKDTIKDVSVN